VTKVLLEKGDTPPSGGERIYKKRKIKKIPELPGL